MKKGSSDHLVMNLTVAGGCGKSFVFNASRSMCEQFCIVIGKPFTSSVFIVSATTNLAATQIGGYHPRMNWMVMTLSMHFQLTRRGI